MSVIVPIEGGFRVEGIVSFDTVVALRKAGEALIAKSTPQDILIDLSLSEAQDASCFSLLFAWIRFSQQQHRPIYLRFTGAPLSLRRMQQLFGLGNLIQYG
ncbi:MAG: hypothetical protein A3E84_03010 [Gammaproteobacteria bacterium RIFCSPHIGHO2_12_FULL_42_13]|nr:MAG: hypothetical protein A3E84_03010 [Gammaproteobacteria bacterium RIFCSPHIGHO2_12_FULL_42_13]